MEDKRPADSWLSRLAASIRDFFRKLFKGKRERTTPTEHNNDADNLDNDKFFNEFLRSLVKWDDVTVRLGIYDRISSMYKLAYEYGRQDGALGVQLKNFVNMAHAHALDTYVNVKSKLNRKLTALKEDLKAAEIEEKNERQQYDHENNHYRDIKNQHKSFPREYSLLLFVFYFFVGIALILADIPLALRLIQRGFDLPGAMTPELGFPYLFYGGNFWKIISLNWETFFTAVGIALCTVYIKISYDEFLGTSMGNKRRIFDEFVRDHGGEDKKGLRDAIEREHKQRIAMRIVLLVFTILCIVVLALFRRETLALENIQVRSSAYSGWAFLGITLLFPVMSGTCLSLALTNLQNLRRMQATRSRQKDSKKSWQKAVGILTSAQKNCHDVEQAAADHMRNEAQVLKTYQDSFTSFYERGYAIGRMQPERYTKGEDFFTKILEWRNMAVARKITNHISNLN